LNLAIAQASKPAQNRHFLQKTVENDIFIADEAFDLF